ncbi:MAG: response regulator [Deltaproteobacteria bacterium]|jgi:DNA-binding response OmpR family regulator|uniref:response regulator n=1 Tax=Hydrosulfovibrio ferrireducens TaxID=2934181 RepID=UPI001225FAAF|nr:MAG: response regulator [Deltaproteobacteria bacterium]
MAEKLKILIAEDEEVTRHLFQIAFRDEERFESRQVTNGEEALVAFKSWQPDIVLIDIMMPQMNGFETLQTIRQTLNDTTTTVIMVSAVTDKQDIVACAKLGIQGYVLKPFQAKTLAETVVGYHRQHKKVKKLS